MFPLLSRVWFWLTEASSPEAGYSARTPAETVKQWRRDGLCRGSGDRSLMNIVSKKETLSDFLWHTTTKKIDIQHKKTSQQLKCIWLNNVWRLYQATVCARIQASFLMVMNHGAEAHTTGTQSHFGIFERKNEKKHESSFTTLKHAPSGF